jgi:hypothetical protein
MEILQIINAPSFFSKKLLKKIDYISDCLERFINFQKTELVQKTFSEPTARKLAVNNNFLNKRPFHLESLKMDSQKFFRKF